MPGLDEGRGAGRGFGGGGGVIYRSKVKVIKMLVVVVVVFAFSWLPLYVVNLWMLYGDLEGIGERTFVWLVQV